MVTKANMAVRKECVVGIWVRTEMKKNQNMLHEVVHEADKLDTNRKTPGHRTIQGKLTLPSGKLKLRRAGGGGGPSSG